MRIFPVYMADTQSAYVAKVPLVGYEPCYRCGMTGEVSLAVFSLDGERCGACEGSGLRAILGEAEWVSVMA